MPTWKHHVAWITSLMLGTSALAGDITSWQVMQGDWSAPGNWTGGEPTASSTAIIGNAGVAFINTVGETCSQLIVGQAAEGTISVFDGALTVGNSILIGNGADGVVSQLGGAVAATTLDLRVGGYGLSGGTLDIVTGSVGDLLGGGNLVISGGSTLTVSNDLTILADAFFGISGGNVISGTTTADDLLVQGDIVVTFTSTVTLQNLTFDGALAGLTFNIAELGPSTIDVAGTLTMAGRLTVTDLNAPVGRHSIVIAAAVTGAFTDISLPTSWTSGIDGTTLWVEKSGVPVETATWSEVKAAF